MNVTSFSCWLIGLNISSLVGTLLGEVEDASEDAAQLEKIKKTRGEGLHAVPTLSSHPRSQRPEASRHEHVQL